MEVNIEEEIELEVEVKVDCYRARENCTQIEI